jgi:hypothetical protein
MANLLKLFVVMLALLPCGMALACRGPFPSPISQDEAFSRAEAVFIARVEQIISSLPDDYIAPNGLDLVERRKELDRQEKGQVSLGRTIILQIEKSWKGVGAKDKIDSRCLFPEDSRIDSCSVAGLSIKLVELTPTNTCEWQSDIHVGDRLVVFAAKNGNYLTMPRVGFDGRSLYTMVDPVVRHGKIAADHPYAKAIADETARFEKIIQSLPH